VRCDEIPGKYTTLSMGRPVTVARDGAEVKLFVVRKSKRRSRTLRQEPSDSEDKEL